MKHTIQTDKAPQAIGPYSQAIRSDALVFLSGQIALDPNTQTLVQSSIEDEIHQVFANLSAVCTAAGGSLQDLVKISIFLTDLNDFAVLNTIMAEKISAPYPARAVVQVSALPKGARVEMEAILALPTR